MVKARQSRLVLCPPQDEIQAFARGDLPHDTIEQIGAHIETCNNCSAFLDRCTEWHDTSIDDLRIAFDDTVSALQALVDEPECRQMQDRIRYKTKDVYAPTIDVARDKKSFSAADETHIGPYFILKELGRGGFATVYLAKDPNEERRVAIKVLRLDRSGDEYVDLFLREAQTAAALDHPNIVPVLDYGELADGRCYLVMRYIEGNSLAEAMNTEVIDKKRAAQIVCEVAKGLHYAHQRSLVHRDIKPANILLDGRGNTLIADFGLAVSDDWNLHREDFAGTIPYMSPEQILDPAEIVGKQRHVDARSDVWSLGVVFYQLLTRKRPFSGSTLDEWREQIVHREPKAPRLIDDTIPVELERIVLQCLRKSVAERPATALDLANHVDKWLHPAPVVPPKVKYVATAAILCVACLVFFGIRFAFNGKLRPEFVDDEVTLNEPFSLLQHEPTAVFVSKGRNPKPTYSAKKRELHIDCGDIAFMELGKTKSNDFVIQVDIHKNVWSGDAGFYFGLDRDLLASGAECPCSTVMLRCVSPDDVRIECGSLSLKQRPQGIDVVGGESYAEYVVQHSGLLGATLDVEIQSGRLKHIRWNGFPLPHEFFEWVPDHLGFANSFGVVNRNGATTFRDAKFVVLMKGL